MKKTFKWLSSFTLLSAVMAVMCVIVGNLKDIELKAETVSVASIEEDVRVVVDPGHGGEDGGCIGEDNTAEKDLNLAVAKKLYHILKASGINTVMTRNDDTMLYDMYSDLNDYSGMKKTYDLRNRVRFAKESTAELFVSIHMNKFSEKEYSGFQVYYSDNDSKSVDTALKIQSTVKENLQRDNERQIKKANDSIYVLHRAQIPAVLCECGFLSNREELERLKSSDYQSELALCIAVAVIDSLGEGEG